MYTERRADKCAQQSFLNAYYSNMPHKIMPLNNRYFLKKREREKKKKHPNAQAWMQAFAQAAILSATSHERLLSTTSRAASPLMYAHWENIRTLPSHSQWLLVEWQCAMPWASAYTQYARQCSEEKQLSISLPKTCTHQETSFQVQ